MKHNRDHERSKPTPSDSPWFWASLFCTAGLIVLVLMEPKFRSRQPQLERQYQARQRSGLVASGADGPADYSIDGRPKITLRPLYVIVAGALLFTWGMWLRERFGAP